jgi:hypothetical protein
MEQSNRGATEGKAQQRAREQQQLIAKAQAKSGQHVVKTRRG